MELYQDCYVKELDNGLRVIAEQREGRPLSLGVWVKAGSRDEPSKSSGVSHLLEHLLFKGTTSRTAFQIAEEIDALGGSINGATHKEYTLLFVDVLSHHLEPTLDVLTDLVQSPLLKEEDIGKEKRVVLEEIRMVEDNPQDKVFDLLLANIWKDNHPLSLPVLGKEGSVRNLNRDDILSQFKLYTLQNMILVGVGGVEFEELADLVEAKLGGIEKTRGATKRAKGLPPRYPPQMNPHFHIESKNSQQVHLCLGVEGLKRGDDRRFALEVLNTILGGGMSSSLFKRIREELGLAYAVFSTANYYLDSGLFLIYVGTNPANAPEVIEIAWEEMERLKREPISLERLQLAKEKLKGNLLLALESSHARMVRLGLGEIYALHMPVEEVIARVEAVTEDDVQRVAQELFKEGSLSLTAIGPKKRLARLARFFSNRSGTSC